MAMDDLTLDLATLDIREAAPPVVSGLPPPELRPLAIDVRCNTGNDVMADNVRSAIARRLPEITVTPAHKGTAILVGGGPSLASQVLETRWWQLQGAHLFALNGAAKFLNDAQIVPDFQVILDPRPQNVKFLECLVGQRLLASQCAPELFDAAVELGRGNTSPAVFHMAGSALSIVSRHSTCIGGDITVGLAAMNLAYTMGYREIRLYGYDSSFPAADLGVATHHAYPQDLSDQESKELDVQVYDETGALRAFRTNFAMAKQAELFPKAAEILVNADAALYVHGTGLLPTIANALKRNQAA
jgi:hypothetical protein